MISKKLLKYRKPTLLLIFLKYIVFLHSGLMAADFRVDDHYLHSDNGHIKLQWDASDNAVVEVQSSYSPEFEKPKTIYKGLDRASFISGLSDGEHFFRIRENNASWSQTLVINVKHQSLRLAFTLFAIGAIVFLLTVLVVVKGMKQAQTK